MFVKICGMTTGDAVDAAADAGADALGFVFADSPRRVAPERAARLCAGLPPAVLRVAVMRHPTPAEWADVVAVFRPDYLQTDVEDLDALTLPEDVRPLPVYRSGTTRQVPAGARILFEGETSGSGRTADWTQARRLAERCELILAGGLDVDNVGRAIEAVRPWGVDVSSGVERRRGVKDVRKIRAFITRVRELEN